MTAAETRIEEARIQEGAAQARLEALIVHLSSGLAVVRPGEELAVAELLCGWLESVGAGGPDPSIFGHLREEAEFWASIATPAELEAHVAAGLRRIERVHFAAPARKRLLVALWEAMTPEDRAAFLGRVDPRGQFHRQSA
ncbi:MAG: hypothetical protein KDJ82_16205 [Rhodobacteraceae bacterium]|nr:hypothetical protein [Paracoccaceae bacterium]